MSEADRLIARQHANPHAYLGAHPENGSVVVRTFRPAASKVEVVDARRHARGARAACIPGGVFEGHLKGAEAAARLPARGRLRRLRHGHDRRPVPLPADDRRARRAPARRGPPRGAVGAPRRARDARSTASPGPRSRSGRRRARAVSVVGDFNYWDGRIHPMRTLGSSGIWELFLPGVGAGARYKYEILAPDGEIRLKADPVAFETEIPPKTASVVHDPQHEWADEEWLEQRGAESSALEGPMSIYEVHLGSWRLNPLEGNRPLSYLELADELSAYAKDMGFTHIELLPVMAHPFTGSWGYQVTGYFAPTPRFGSPDDLREFVDRLHQNGDRRDPRLGPGALPARRLRARPLRRHRAVRARRPAPRRAPGLGHAGLQLRPPRGPQLPRLQRAVLAATSTTPTASASTPWPRCSTSTTRATRASGCRTSTAATRTWTPSAFLKEFNEVIHGREPGVISAAEESTAWPGVSRPTYLGGLGFGFKWNMGWMHDTLAYFQHDPIYRRYHHHELTFSLVYAFTENFILPLSHDEVVHGKGSLLSEDAGRPLAEARQPALAVRLHVGAPRQEAAVHGPGVRARSRSGARAGRWTGTCSRTPSTPASSRSCATSTRPTRPSRRCGRWTSTAAASGGPRPTPPTTT